MAKTSDPVANEFHPGGAAVWDDLRVPISSTKLNPLQSEPAFEQLGSSGLYAYAFDTANADDESLHFVAQLPHGYKEGSDIEAHIHWSPDSTDTGNVVWQLEYVISNINGAFAFGGVSTLEVTDAADGTQWKHQVTGLGTIPGTGINISAVIIGRLTRLGTDVADTFTGNAFLHEIDFHYQMDTMGSREEYIK